MNFGYTMPTHVVVGRGCVRANADMLRLGGHALIVTGRSSAQNGARRDVIAALQSNGQRYTVFEGVTPNPTLGCVREGLGVLRESGADFVIGVGGGSPMDAAKAIALLAVQPRADGDVFSGGYALDALPMAHVPTTAGTGSEVTQYAILTDERMRTKTSISSPALFPKVAFLDGSYTDTLPLRTTVHTALDAFSHAAESMLKTSSSPMSEMLARESLRILYPLFGSLSAPTCEERDRLLYAACLAGMAIAQTGTTIVHGMGYFLTYDFGIDHGRANGLLLGETFRLCEEKGVPAMRAICAACGADTEEICETVSRLLGAREAIPRARLEEYAARTMSHKNIRKCKFDPSKADVLRIFLRSFPA